MKGYYEGYSYVRIMPDKTKMRFATEQEAKESEEDDDNKDDD